MKQMLSVAAVQMTSGRDPEANLQRAVALCESAAAAGAQLIVLPENFAFLGGDFELLRFSQGVEDGPFTAPLRAVAQNHGVAIVAGSLPEVGPDAEHVYATSVLIGPQGQTLATYRKIHLFDVSMGEATHAESAQIAPGRQAVYGELAGWKVGLSICYDLRFGELYRELVGAGARLFTVPAAFTLHTGKDHWEVLLRARAIESQAYVVAANQFGRHDERRVTWGKSMVIDPWGTVLAAAPEREGFILAMCDAAYQERIRTDLPALRHRRLPG